MNRATRFAPLLLLASAVLLTACPKKPAPPPPPPVNQDSINAAQARADSIARAEAARRDSIAREQARADSIRAAQEAARQAMEALRTTVTTAIHFDYDKSDLTSDAQATLDQKIPVLNANPSLQIRVVGNTDERGSAEYNMALGQRRAAAAKRYLTQHGIDAGRIATVSYGEERPICTDHDESCWSQNRRDEFEITAGGDSLVAPR